MEQTQPGPIAAEVYGQPILLDEVDARIREELFTERVHGNQRLLFELRSKPKALERMIDARILAIEAERRGVSPEEVALLEQKALESIRDDDVRAFYDQYRDRMQGLSFD